MPPIRQVSTTFKKAPKAKARDETEVKQLGWEHRDETKVPLSVARNRKAHSSVLGQVLLVCLVIAGAVGRW